MATCQQFRYSDKESGQVAYEARFSPYRPQTERWEDQPEEVKAIWRTVERAVAAAEARRREMEVAKELQKIWNWGGGRETPASLAAILRDYQECHPTRGRLDWSMLAAAKFLDGLQVHTEAMAALTPPAAQETVDA